MPQLPPDQYATFDTLRNRLRVTGTLVAQTALRIGAGRASDVVGNDLPVLRDGRNRPFIPGASLKGAFRARLEALIRTVIPAPEAVELPQLDDLLRKLERVGDDAATIDAHVRQMAPYRAVLDFQQIEERTRRIGQFKQAELARRLSDKQLSQIICRCASLIDLTFGSPELAGRIFFKDAQVDEGFWFDTFEVRNGVAINRDTETVEGSLLYDYEVVPAGTRFHFALTLENAADWQLGMVLVALKAWQNGDVQLGGFRSRGLGYVQLVDPVYDHHQVQPGDVDSVLRLVCDAGTLEAMGVAPASGAIDEAAWLKAFREQLSALAREEASDA